MYEIDENGYIKEIYVEDTETTQYITVDPPQGLYRAKWTGARWIEDMTQEEIDALNNQPKEPSELEVQQEIINTLGQELAQLKLQFMVGGI